MRLGVSVVVEMVTCGNHRRWDGQISSLHTRMVLPCVIIYTMVEFSFDKL